MFFILLVSSISLVSQFFKHFTKVEKITIRWIAAIQPSYNRPQLVKFPWRPYTQSNFPSPEAAMTSLEQGSLVKKICQCCAVLTSK